MVKRKNEELSAKRRKLKESKSFLINGDSIHVCIIIIIKIALERKESDHYTTLQAEHEARQMMKSQVSVIYSTTGSGHFLESG